MTNFGTHKDQNFLAEKIFYSGKNKQIRIKANRYQYILKFLLSDQSKSHKITKIQDAIFSDAPQLFKSDMNKKPSEIKKNQNRQFNEMLNDLENWKLVISSPTKSEKGGVQTKEYSLTFLGTTIGLLVQYTVSVDKQNSFDKLFASWRDYLANIPSSLNTFCLNYLTKCRNAGLFDNFARLYIDTLIHNNYGIQNEIDLFTQMILTRYEKSKSENEHLWDLWQHVFRDMIPDEYQMFIHHLKLHIGRQIVRKVQNFSVYEDIRYDIRGDYDDMVIEVNCKNCAGEYFYQVVSVFSYLIFLFTDDTRYITHEYAYNLKCKICNSNNFEIMSI